MSLHLFGSVITAHGVAANNRGENEGNISTLQKLLWQGNVHTTVSSEAIRWAIRYYWQKQGFDVNRVWDYEKEDHIWQDPVWAKWQDYIDDDVLGFMKAEGAKDEGEKDNIPEEETEKPTTGKKKKAPKAKGTISKRRGVLEVARAISTTPFVGDITFNAKSGEKGSTSLYGTEVHATRYQYGFAITPEHLSVPVRVLQTIDAIINLGEVAGNHGRFLFDFSPDSIILRITEDPAPRILYCFEENSDGTILVPQLLRRVKTQDILPSELYIGGNIADNQDIKTLEGIHLFPGIKETVSKYKEAVQEKLS